MRLTRFLSPQTSAVAPAHGVGHRVTWRDVCLKSPGELDLARLLPQHRLRAQAARAMLRQPAAVHGVEHPRMGDVGRGQLRWVDALGAAVAPVPCEDRTGKAVSPPPESLVRQHLAASVEI